MPPRVRRGYSQVVGSVRKRRYNLRTKRRRNQRGKGLGTKVLAKCWRRLRCHFLECKQIRFVIFDLYTKTLIDTDSLLTNDENEIKKKTYVVRRKKVRRKTQRGGFLPVIEAIAGPIISAIISEIL